ncbi:MAG: hypothetical protein ACREHG_00495 [Candidatus Saccharimonadales bacterium]
MANTYYHAPDTSDRDPDETWQQYWDRKMDERHDGNCECMLHQMRRILVEHPKDCHCPVCPANRYVKDMIR